MKLKNRKEVLSTFPKIIRHKNHPLMYLFDEGIEQAIAYLYEWLDKETTTKNIKFGKLKPVNGIIKVICKNKETVEWLIKVVNEINIKDKSEFEVVSGAKQHKLQCISVKISDAKLTSSKLFKRLEQQNDGLSIFYWNTLGTYEHVDGDLIWIIEIDKKSGDFIRKQNMRLSRGFSEIFVRFEYNYEGKEMSKELKEFQMTSRFNDSLNVKDDEDDKEDENKDDEEDIYF